jgi:hypothetical protein
MISRTCFDHEAFDHPAGWAKTYPANRSFLSGQVLLMVGYRLMLLA